MASNIISKKIQLAPGRKKNNALILDCFRDVTRLKQYWNKWIVADVWVDIINDRFDITDSLKFESKELNAAISRNGNYRSNQIDATTMPNGIGLYKSWRKKRDDNQKMTTTYAYFATAPNVLPTPPGGNTIWHQSIMSTLQSETRFNKRSLPMGGLMQKEKRRGYISQWLQWPIRCRRPCCGNEKGSIINQPRHIAGYNRRSIAAIAIFK
jgi:hypothetical protein